MKYEVTLKRKPTLNESQNARTKRVECYAPDKEAAKNYVLTEDHSWRYFTVDSVREVR